MIPARKTRTIRIGPLQVGGDAPIAVQSMAATRTQDIAATRGQVERLQAAGADLVRVAIDSPKDAEALEEIARGIHVPLSVDLQENYRMAAAVAPFVAKLRYNPGHLHHHERDKTSQEKVAWIVDVARRHDCAIRIGVNAGSIAPEYKERYPGDDVGAIVACAVEHCALLDGLDFRDFVVSIKDSDPRLVIDANTRFAEARPDVPIHLGVTEAGMPPEGIIKTRIAFEQLLSRGIGDTMNSWLIRNVAARLAAGSPPAEWGWKAFELQAGAAQSNANVTGWGNQPTYNIFGPPGFQTGRTLPK